jgi:hypothetical protein
MTFEIAKGIKNTDWLKLNLGDSNSNDWNHAIDFFDRRFTDRYFDPIRILEQYETIERPENKKFGFVCLAIDCLLIETFQQFYQGIENSDVTGAGGSTKVFCNFLEQRDSFKSDFNRATTDDRGRDIKISEKFYMHFRCGILHQAEVKRGSKIWSVGSLIVEQDGNLRVNRMRFHENLVKEYENYKGQIQNGNLELRTNFVKKMNFISRDNNPSFVI